jgi:hypothetical protein
LYIMVLVLMIEYFLTGCWRFSIRTSADVCCTVGGPVPTRTIQLDCVRVFLYHWSRLEITRSTGTNLIYISLETRIQQIMILGLFFFFRHRMRHQPSVLPQRASVCWIGLNKSWTQPISAIRASWCFVARTTLMLIRIKAGALCTLVHNSWCILTVPFS